MDESTTSAPHPRRTEPSVFNEQPSVTTPRSVRRLGERTRGHRQEGLAVQASSRFKLQRATSRRPGPQTEGRFRCPPRLPVDHHPTDRPACAKQAAEANVCQVARDVAILDRLGALSIASFFYSLSSEPRRGRHVASRVEGTADRTRKPRSAPDRSRLKDQRQPRGCRRRVQILPIASGESSGASMIFLAGMRPVGTRWRALGST